MRAGHTPTGPRRLGELWRTRHVQHLPAHVRGAARLRPSGVGAARVQGVSRPARALDQRPQDTGVHLGRLPRGAAVRAEERRCHGAPARPGRHGRGHRGNRLRAGPPRRRARDLFLSDADLAASAAPETFLPTAPVLDLYPFHLLPQLSEPNVLSYAFASGLIADALSLDERGALPPPATGASSFTFRFRPHATTATVLEQAAGQVEVDAMFVAQRGGRPCLFVLEAKVGTSRPSLAKHKLAYPVLALAGALPPDMQVVPVYARFSRSETGLWVLVAECRFDGARGPNAVPVLSGLTAHAIRLFTMPKHLAVGFSNLPADHRG